MFGPYGIGNRRARGGAVSVCALPTVSELTHPDSDVELVEMEVKYDELQSTDTMDQDMITVEPVFPSQSQEEELKTRAAMEYRGKTAPSSREERSKLIDEEHAHGHFGREAIYRALYLRGYW